MTRRVADAARGATATQPLRNPLPGRFDGLHRAGGASPTCGSFLQPRSTQPVGRRAPLPATCDCVAASDRLALVVLAILSRARRSVLRGSARRLVKHLTRALLILYGQRRQRLRGGRATRGDSGDAAVAAARGDKDDRAQQGHCAARGRRPRRLKICTAWPNHGVERHACRQSFAMSMSPARPPAPAPSRSRRLGPPPSRSRS